MPGLSAALANVMLAAVKASDYEYVKMHIGDPGPNGTANPAAETTRKLINWSDPASGSMFSVDDLEYESVAATEIWTHYSLWTAATAGTFGHSGTLNPKSVTATDDITVPSGSVSMTFPLAA